MDAAVVRPWLLRFAKLVLGGIVVAIAVTEIQLGLGVDLLDAPFFHVPAEAIGLGLAALAYAAFQTRPGARPAGMAASLVAFAIVVLPFGAFSERPAIPIEFWKGTTGLLLDRTMTVDRPHRVSLVIKAAEPLTRAGPVPAQELFNADTIVGRLFGEPRASFTIVPEGDQPRPISVTEDMSWTWTATPRHEGPQRLVLELDTLKKGAPKGDRASSLFRQLIVVRVQPPSWYEAARNWLFGLGHG
ncbi:MAG: hypothetical protein JO339_06035 [Alphaproteobacteria bacterium]|nr:hypothetical protein [Alphaproteobacteria bacterium]